MFLHSPCFLSLSLLVRSWIYHGLVFGVLNSIPERNQLQGRWRFILARGAGVSMCPGREGTVEPDSSQHRGQEEVFIWLSPFPWFPLGLHLFMVPPAFSPRSILSRNTLTDTASSGLYNLLGGSASNQRPGTVISFAFC